MMSSTHQRAGEIFLEACELDPAHRAALLERACGSDPELRAAVERLLVHDGDPGGFERGVALRTYIERIFDPLESYDEHGATSMNERPKQVGGYHIIDVLGEGGFGIVYHAEQSQPVRRPVALKVIKRGMDSRQVIARFAAERQALALLNHPCIAKIFDAGEAETGQPYFAMELAEGVPISVYCDAQRLDLPARLAIFLSVCGAIQHAHQRGIIHRDLKPSNVLVTGANGDPAPKVIDFGIAKAVGSDSSASIFTTQEGQPVGTPQYMSPEQAAGERDIDTRTDIYSMGILLYQLVSGMTPFDHGAVGHADLRRILELIRESDPPTPSARLKTIGPSAEEIAAQRRTDMPSLRRMLRGDLDWIVMKAIERDRSRRYETINALADDLRRYLRHETVLARPPTMGYRFRKFARRRRGALVAAAALAITLVAGIAGTTIGLVRALAARDAEARQRDRAEAIIDLLQSALMSSDPYVGGKQDKRISEVMHGAVQRLNAGEFRAHPQTEAQLCLTFSRILRDNAHAAEALPLAEQALSTFERLHRNPHGDVARAQEQVAAALHSLGRHTDAEARFRAALSVAQRLDPADPEDISRMMNGLGGACQAVGRFAEAEQWFRDAMVLRERLHHGDHFDLAVSLTNIAQVLQLQGRTDEAVQYFDDSVAMLERLYPNGNPATARAKGSLALLSLARGRAEDAESLARDALEMARRLFPGGHPEVSLALNNLAIVLQATRRALQAVPLLREALDLQRQFVVGEHPDLAWSMANLGVAVAKTGRTDEGLALLREALSMNQRLFPGDHPSSVTYSTNLALCLAMTGRLPEARDMADTAAEMAQRALPENHPIRRNCHEVLAKIRTKIAGAPSAGSNSAQPLNVD